MFWFLSTYSNKKVLHGFDESHVSNIPVRYEVQTTSGNTFFKGCYEVVNGRDL